MRVLVTGAGGFVGRWLVEHLKAEGDHVVAADHGDVDVTDAATTAGLFAAVRPEACYHLAGISFAPDARRDPAAAFRTNVIGTVHVLEAARLESPGCAVLVPGSAEVYGAPRRSDLPLTEDVAPAPQHPYAGTKLAQEAVVRSYAAAYGVRALITRSFNHTGPGQRTDFVVPSLVRQVAMEGTVRVGNIDVSRDFTDVRDVVRAYRLLVLSGEPGVPYNVCSGRAVSIRSIIGLLGEIAGRDVETIVETGRVRPNEPPEVRGSSDRLSVATGWKPEIALRQTLADMLAAAKRDSAQVTAAGSPATR